MTTKTSPPEPVRFAEMPLSAEARQGLEALGYERATPVQAATFGPAMEGNDLVVQSKTGTGKTTAFGLPLIERIRMDEQLVDPQSLILCPTRELAIQVAEELAELGDPKGVRVMTIYGGTPMGPQLKGLKAGCDVIVGTPGRVLDHIRRRTLRLVHVHVAVLDEADEMLSMGFWDDVTSILDKLPDERQTFLFSATLPDQIRKAAALYLRNPQSIDISRDELTVEGIANIYYERDDSLPKPRNLLYVLEVSRPDSAIIFCNTRDDASVVASFLRRQGLNALALSGEFGQKERERIMGRMKRGDLQYLVATDIAARGIDISDLSHVFNYSLPDFTEVYVHRVGRTGRIGKTGTAISLVSGMDEMTFTQLRREFGIKWEKKELPERSEILKLQAERLAAEILQEAREVELTSFTFVAEHLRNVAGSTEAIAFLLKRYFAQVEEAREAEAREEDERLRKLQDKRIKRGGDDEAEADDARDRKRDRGDRDRGDRDRGDRGRRDRPRRSEAPEPEAEPEAEASNGERDSDAVRLFVNRGKSHGFSESQVRDLVIDIAGTGESNDIPRVQLRRTHAFVEVNEAIASAAIAASERGVERDDKPVTVERARTR